jgi:hypothetical protein
MIVSDIRKEQSQEDPKEFFELSNHEVVRLEKNSSEFFA